MDTEGNSPPPAAAPAESSVARAAVSWLRELTLSVVIAIVVILFLYQPVKVEGTSMTPGLRDQERIFINKFIYNPLIYRLGLADISRGDTVVFWYPNDPSKSYIKRVIGLPGDTVEIVKGTVLVNGNTLSEPYVPESARDEVSMPRITVEAGAVHQEDKYFVLGDNRRSSNDSRTWGLVPRSDIYGKAVFGYWPLDRLGLLH